MTKASMRLYDEVIQLTQDYLGPAAERFVTRQIKTHIGKKPENLEPADVKKLDEWIRVALALLTDDEKLLENFSTDLMKLAEDKGK